MNAVISFSHITNKPDTPHEAGSVPKTAKYGKCLPGTKGRIEDLAETFGLNSQDVIILS